MSYKSLDLTAQTAYAELLNACIEPAFDGTGISFSSKTIKGKKYWYINAKIGNRPFQRYLGPDNENTEKLIAREKSTWSKNKASRETRARLVNMVLAGGVTGVLPQEGKILQLLERAGIFMAGGVLVGTPAFRALSNQLGVIWASEQRTKDIDIALDYRLPLAVPDKSIDLTRILNESGMGFLQVPALDTRHPSTKYSLTGRDYYVDILTPDIYAPAEQPIYLKSINTHAMPLRYLDYLIENTEPAVIPFNIGILVNVPDPARFALHKLVLTQRRFGAQKTKTSKDLSQASQLLDVLLDTRPGAILEAYDAARPMGTKFNKQLSVGISLLDADLQKRLQEWIGSL